MSILISFKNLYGKDFMAVIRVGITDDKSVNRTTIGEKIQQFEDLDLCFLAVNGSDCLEQLKGLPLDKMPQIIFMDLEMPEMNGIQAIALGRSLYPQIYFIVLTVFDDDDKIFEAIKAGAHGYLMKDESALELHHAVISAVIHEGAPMSPSIARKALQLLSAASMNKPENKPVEDHTISTILTEKEKEILKQIVAGNDAKRIAQFSGTSVLTVRKHVSNIYKKLHVNNKAQVMKIAYDKKMID